MITHGIDKHLDGEDPFELVAVYIPTTYDAQAEMARTFIEEFALMGWPRARIMRMFQIPRFAGPHSVYEERGEAFVRGLVDEVFGGAESKVRVIEEQELEPVIRQVSPWAMDEV